MKSTLLTSVVITLLVLVGVLTQVPAADSSSLVPFSHRIHTDDVGAECSDCHTGASSSVTAADDLLPQLSTCYECHDAEEEVFSAAQGTDRAPFLRSEREFVFDHAMHTQMDGIDCATCHAGVETADAGASSHLPSMSSCVSCHRESQVVDECMLCHTDPGALRPTSHTFDFFDRHGELVRAGDPSCANCHTNGRGAYDCQICHEGDQTLATTALPTDHLSGGVSTNDDGAVPQRLQGVHALDFRFNHGLEARGKQSDCAVCHVSSTFCTDCHNDEQNSMRPLWHGGNDWGAIPGGVGTGGGVHGARARRDIENCATCHDVQGNDPSCLACHMDANPGLGNDPRTHEAGFLRQEQGLWHDDPGDTCYACHRPSSGSAPGFCTYCHGPRP